MAVVKFVNPQPYPCGIADRRGSRMTIRPGEIFSGDEVWFSKFISPKSIQRYVETPEQLSTIEASKTIANAGPVALDAAAREVAKLKENEDRTESGADALGDDGVNAGEAGGEDRFADKTATEWTAEVLSGDLAGIPRGTLVGVAQFLLGEAHGVKGQSAGKFATALRDKLQAVGS